MVMNPLINEPDNEAYDCSFKLKTDWCAVHPKSTGTLQQGNVLSRCLFSIGRLNLYQGRYCWACVLKSALINDTPTEHTPIDADAMRQRDLDMLDMDE